MSDAELSGNLPVIHVTGATITEGWERAMVACWERGVQVDNKYDAKQREERPDLPLSRECQLIVELPTPRAEPLIPKAISDGLVGMYKYVWEVVDGIHDHWIDPHDPQKWDYTYHDRLTNFNRAYPEAGPGVDQLETCLRKMAAAPADRRLIAHTFYPWFDLEADHGPCLIYVWYRVIEREGVYWLNQCTHWRSRDLFKGWPLNVVALVLLQEKMAQQLAARTGWDVRLGSYIDTSNSAHIYGSYYADPDQSLSVQGFLESLSKRAPEDRAYRSDDPVVRDQEAEARVCVAYEDFSGKKGIWSTAMIPAEELQRYERTVEF
jgi:thymidylate synthase